MLWLHTFFTTSLNTRIAWICAQCITRLQNENFYDQKKILAESCCHLTSFSVFWPWPAIYRTFKSSSFQKEFVFNFSIFYIFINVITTPKNIYSFQTQNNDLFISLKRKNTILEMTLKSFFISKLDHQMSKSQKRTARHVFETISKFDGWKTEYLIAQLRTGFR